MKEQTNTQPPASSYPNPFERLENALSRIEALLQESQAQSQTAASSRGPASPLADYIPVQEIFKSGLRSKPAFYQDVKNGIIPLFKMGNRSYVRVGDFHNAFKKINISGGQKGGARG